MSDSSISKKTLEHLAELSRIKLNEKEEEKLLEDLRKILAYFDELKSLDTSSVEPMNGGTDLKNSFREDEERLNTNQGNGADVFPESKDGFLKVPPVFQ
ncbi:MAG: Asp-tRNA(Asn)/Glu-tRNA(Gln) amidotransferase subunit GatC [Candidatus Liptonbacteria bacterium]|nr:Asp-tRNA(Asn)/Glu-tRNA(Gln) amidotransferase subunit GatC [Candidatus Liptonbacteria bacterium]